MSDANPSPVEVKAGGKQAASPKQIAMVAVLGVVLVVLLVTQLPKMLGGSSSSEPVTPAPVAAAPAVTPAPSATPAPVEVTPPPERPRRSPFDVPR